MTALVYAPRIRVLLLVMACAALAVGGCSRTKYRLQADRQAYDVIAERNVTEQWCVEDYGIELDRRSRYFDPYDPDCSPMPQDDPTSHQYMHCVAGMKGWKHWHDNGQRTELENPAWVDALPEYVDITEDGAVELTQDSALRLAYMHSPSHQNQLETLYLSALDVTAERFRLDTQFFGGYDARYAHSGALIPPGLRSPAIEGADSNLLTVGRPFAGNPALQASRRLATAGEILVGFANSFVFEFTGGDANLAASLASFSFVQPLLRGAGRDIALEQLTIVERDLLANLRAYSQYRQGFYTQVAIGELGVTGPQRGGASTSLAVFPGQGGVGGYIDLLEQLQRIRNTEDNLSLQLRILAQLEAYLDVGMIDLVQVAEFRQSVEDERSSLLLSRNGFEFALDRYKTATLGLPPDLPIELDESLIRQFQLVAREATVVQDSIAELQDRVGELPDDAGVEPIGQVLADASKLIGPVERQLDDTQTDVAHMETAAPGREQIMTDDERIEFQGERERLREGLADLRRQFEQAKVTLTALRDELSEETKEATAHQNVIWLGSLLRLVQGSILVQARARLETVSVEAIELGSEEAFSIALDNRMDFMNGRAALVDSWRLIQFNADALQSVVNVTANGDIRTARDNAVSFRAPTANLRLGLEFDAPFTRLLERNDYRRALIDYQRNRRAFIQSRDSLHLGLRELLRQIEEFRVNLEIRRRAVAIAIQRVELTRLSLYAPVRPPQPGQRPAQFGPTAAQDMLRSLSALRSTQNRFMNVWLNYYASRMRLARELGVMQLDQAGQWIERPAPGPDQVDQDDGVWGEPEELELPPAVPVTWIDLAEVAPQDQSVDE